MVTKKAAGLYELLQVECTAGASQIKQAYYRLALLHHPDRGASGDGSRFVQISRAYEVLSDEKLRAIYDSTGRLPENDDGAVDLAGRFRDMFSRVTRADIDAFKKQYVGSAEELEDLLAAYVKHDGDMGAISDAVFFGSADEEERYRSTFRRAIERGIVVPLGDMLASEKAYAKGREKRVKKQRREAAEAEKHAKELGIDSKADLVSLIRSKNDTFLDALEHKYAAAEKGKRRKA